MRPHRQITPLDVGALLPRAVRERIARASTHILIPKRQKLVPWARIKADAICRMAGMDALPEKLRRDVHENGKRAGHYEHPKFTRAYNAARRRPQVKALLAEAAEMRGTTP